MTIATKIVALHRALDAPGIPHAFGGALALAYWTLDPRGTNDIDINVFLPAESPGAALEALPKDLKDRDGNLTRLRESGQARLWWGDNPVDLFFDYAEIHSHAARNIREVPFERETIPVLGPVELAVFKVMSDRTRDWADIEAMIGVGTLDVKEVSRLVAAMGGAKDPRVTRLADLNR